jgi:hypothetical protein
MSRYRNDRFYFLEEVQVATLEALKDAAERDLQECFQQQYHFL